MTQIAITGAKGTVGTALAEQLGTKYDIIPLDLPEFDINDHDRLRPILKASSVVIHLAGIFGPSAKGMENWLSPHIDQRNFDLFHATMITAQDLAERAHTDEKDSNLKQFIHASSIHVEDTLGFLAQGSSDLLTVRDDPVDGRRAIGYQTELSSGYGENKRAQEELVSHFAHLFPHGAVSLRLGGVTPNNLPVREHRRPEVVDHEQRVWLEHGDLGRLVEAIIERPNRRKYDAVYAVSANDGRFHDTNNVFGWGPQANSADYL